MSAMHAHQMIEQTARDSYGRLVAFLAVRWRDPAAAEDALADAFLAALESWPATGVPDNPDAWLLTAASACRCGANFDRNGDKYAAMGRTRNVFSG